MHPELESLVEAALADNKLTAKEMEVLIRKAKSLGIDEDEFLIELDAKKYHKKKLRKGESKGGLRAFLNREISHREAGLRWQTRAVPKDSIFDLKPIQTERVQVPVNARTIRVGHILIPLVSVLVAVFILVGSLKLRTDYYEELDLALVNFNIERAYECLAHINPKYISHRKILRVAVPLYIKNGNTTGALDLLNEYGFYFKISDANWYNEEVEFFNSLIILISNSLVTEGNKKLAEEIIETKLKPYADVDGKPTYAPVIDRKAFVLKNISKKI